MDPGSGAGVTVLFTLDYYVIPAKAGIHYRPTPVPGRALPGLGFRPRQMDPGSGAGVTVLFTPYAGSRLGGRCVGVLLAFPEGLGAFPGSV
jgi:hypothetical protein